MLTEYHPNCAKNEFAKGSVSWQRDELSYRCVKNDHKGAEITNKWLTTKDDMNSLHEYIELLWVGIVQSLLSEDG